MNTNIRLVRGDTYAFSSVAILDGEVFNLTNYTVTLTCKRDLNDNSPFFQLTSPLSGIEVTDATAGEFTVTIPSSATTSLERYVYRLPYDIKITNGSINHTLTRGYLIVVPGVT